jgi:hypothetical protein
MDFTVELGIFGLYGFAEGNTGRKEIKLSHLHA